MRQQNQPMQKKPKTPSQGFAKRSASHSDCLNSTDPYNQNHINFLQNFESKKDAYLENYYQSQLRIQIRNLHFYKRQRVLLEKEEMEKMRIQQSNATKQISDLNNVCSSIQVVEEAESNQPDPKQYMESIERNFEMLDQNKLFQESSIQSTIRMMSIPLASEFSDYYEKMKPTGVHDFEDGTDEPKKKLKQHMKKRQKRSVIGLDLNS